MGWTRGREGSRDREEEGNRDKKGEGETYAARRTGAALTAVAGRSARASASRHDDGCECVVGSLSLKSCFCEWVSVARLFDQRRWM